MPDRQDQSDLLGAQLATGGAALGFLLAAVGGLFVNYGTAIGLFAGAIMLAFAANNFHVLARVKLQWPLVQDAAQVHSYWHVFKLSSYAAVIVSILLSLILGGAFYLVELKRELRTSEARQEIRHLTGDQKVRMRQALQLKLNETYEFQLNSMPSCDECEQFAEELRTFINSIPGWKVGGGPLIFPQPPRRGLWLVSRDEEKHSVPVDKLDKAFRDAGLPLMRSSEETQPGTFVILVARPGV